MSGFRWRYKVWEVDDGQWSFWAERSAGSEWEVVLPKGPSVRGSRELAEMAAQDEIERDRKHVENMDERGRRALQAEWKEVS